MADPKEDSSPMTTPLRAGEGVRDAMISTFLWVLKDAKLKRITAGYVQRSYREELTMGGVTAVAQAFVAAVVW